ncbi:ABC transporter ATP-binding protein [Gordonia sp. (in: high G+C Gram-positive bacteria)]|uniref:ABC transporter ATP-binding protein n=1 Tax=Gordonia sp. (in: high G+C Gram-positive bacteria) TaxID=84139 RepID=UPI003340817F
MKIFRALGEVRRFLGAGRSLTWALALAIVSALLTVAVPWLLAQVTNIIFAGALGANLDEGATHDQMVEALRDAGDDRQANIVSAIGATPGVGIDWSLLWTYTAVTLAAFVLAAGARIGGGLILNAAVQRAIRRLRRRVESKLHRMPVTALEGGRRGEVLNAVTVDVDNVATLIGPVFVQLPVVLLTIVGVSAALIWVSGFFAMIAFLTVPISAVAVALILRFARPHVKRQWAAQSSLTAHAEDVYAARDMLSAYDAHRATERQFTAVNSELAHATRTGQTWSGALGPVLTLCNALAFVTVAVLGAFKMLDGAVTLGVLQAVVLYTQQLSSALSELTGTLPTLQSGLVSVGRVREFLARKEEIAPAVDDDPVTPRHGRHRTPPRIVFEDVSFAYTDGPPVLNGVDLVVEPGTTTALVGATGSGKTTLTALVQRFADPTGGRITVDGTDITDLTRSEVRSLMAVVTQDPWLFTGTAGENIDLGAAHGVETADPTVHTLLAALPSGAATEVSGDVETLSAGEKQLITVARALAAQPDILILDEATSAADPRSELLIQRGLESLRHRTTTLIVTHRMSTLAAADEVAVLAGGRIVEQGTAQDLLAAGGEFARIYAE